MAKAIVMNYLRIEHYMKFYKFVTSLRVVKIMVAHSEICLNIETLNLEKIQMSFGR